MRTEALLTASPQWQHVASLDETVRLVRRDAGPAIRFSEFASAPEAGAPPVHDPVPPVADAPPDARPVVAEQGKRWVEADDQARAVAEPDRGEVAYLRAMERLRQRYLNLRIELSPMAETDFVDEQRTRVAAMHRLEIRISALEETPVDRVRYSPVELRRRQALRAELRKTLDGLREAQIRRLEQALEPPARVIRSKGGEIPAEELERAELVRDRLRQEQVEARARETFALMMASRPAPATVMPVPAPTLFDTGDEPPAVPSALEGDSAQRSLDRALRSLAEQRRELVTRLRESVKRSAVSVGIRKGWDVHFDRPNLPDRTDAIRQAMLHSGL